VIVMMVMVVRMVMMRVVVMMRVAVRGVSIGKLGRRRHQQPQQGPALHP
jgi:hypothetical protein